MRVATLVPASSLYRVRMKARARRTQKPPPRRLAISSQAPNTHAQLLKPLIFNLLRASFQYSLVQNIQALIITLKSRFYDAAIATFVISAPWQDKQ